MLYSRLCELYEILEANPSRLKKTDILSEFLKNLKKEKPEFIYLLKGSLFPDYEEKELGISTQLVIKALSKASGLSQPEIVKKWKKIGDLGKVAEEVIENKKQNTLFSTKLKVEDIIKNLQKLPSLEGKGTVDKKIALISELLTSATNKEAKYIIRTLLSDLRIGVGDGTLRDSIVWACFDKEDKQAYDLVQAAYDKTTDFSLVFEKAVKGKEDLEKTNLSPGKPVKVMLAQKAESIEDGFERVGKPAAFEFKYDGFRMMINKDSNGKIKIFTRRLEQVTNQFPEVVAYIRENVNAETFLIDAEAVGYDPKTQKYLPFQSISQRIKRKYDIEEVAKKFPIEINVFDIIYYNNKSLINEPFETRTKLLRKIIKTKKWHIKPSELLITDNQKEANAFYKKALKEGEEGIMIKNLSAPYKPGSRVGHMLKFKPNNKEFDLVITGAEYGTGKRAGWLSSFDISCSDGDNFLEIGKVGTGIKEKTEGVSFEQLTELLKPLIISESDKHIKVKPKIVITIVYQEIQKSPTYSSGYALRFPRLTALRPDRSTSDIATIDEIRKEAEKN